MPREENIIIRSEKGFYITMCIQPCSMPGLWQGNSGYSQSKYGKRHDALA